MWIYLNTGLTIEAAPCIADSVTPRKHGAGEAPISECNNDTIKKEDEVKDIFVWDKSLNFNIIEDSVTFQILNRGLNKFNNQTISTEFLSEIINSPV